MNFIFDTDKIRGAVKETLNTDECVHCAVAFWGEGASEMLFKKGAKAQILCDLESGATNPNEIAKLLDKKNGQFEVRAINGLHAKVYVGPASVIVGSANASANGLGEEGRDVDSNFEAVIFSKDLNLVEESRKWFERLWNQKARTIVLSELRPGGKIWQAWNNRRKNRPFTNGKSEKQGLLESLIKFPNQFLNRDLYVFAYDKELSDAAEEKIENSSKAHKLKLFGYEDWIGLKPGMIGLEVSLVNKAKPTYNGEYRIIDASSVSKKSRVDMAVKVKKIPDIPTLSRESKKKLCNAVNRNWKELNKSFENKPIPILEIRKYLMK